MFVGTAMHRFFWSILRTLYREVTGRLFVSFDSYLVFLKCITAVSNLGHPLMGCKDVSGSWSKGMVVCVVDCCQVLFPSEKGRKRVHCSLVQTVR